MTNIIFYFFKINILTGKYVIFKNILSVPWFLQIIERSFYLMRVFQLGHVL